MVATIVAAGIGITLWNMSPTNPGRAASRGGATSVITDSNFIKPAMTNLARTGNGLFDRNCAACHGTNALGSDKGPSLVYGIYNPGHHGDDAFYRAAARGTPRHHWNFGDMPPQPQVSRDDVAAIVRYIRELQEANGIFWQKHTM